MNIELKEPLSDFIMEYVSVTDSTGNKKQGEYIMTDVEITTSIGILINNNVFTKIELRKEILRNKNILLSDEFIDKCVGGD